MAVAYHARQQGIKRLGFRPTPSLASAEANGKEAIEMTILIKRLLNSPFANESWTLQDTNAELVLHTNPKRTFKKLPFTVEVWFDDNSENAFPYVNYRIIYASDDNDRIYKAEGQVDYNGCYFVEYNGDKAYFILFGEDALRYGTKGVWSVRYNNTILYPPTSSSRPPTGSSSNVIVLDSSSDEDPEPEPTTSGIQYTAFGQAKRRAVNTSESLEEEEGLRRRAPKSPKTTGVQQRQGEQRSSPVKRAQADSTGHQPGGARGGRGPGGGGGGGRRGGGERAPGSAPTAGEVGQRHISVTERRLTKLERLQEEARDPPIITVKGPANTLKCWRFRLKKDKDLFDNITTVYKWINDTCSLPTSRILIAFSSVTQRQKFLARVTIPKQCQFSCGYLDAL